jgi:hypothetical protein
MFDFISADINLAVQLKNSFFVPIEFSTEEVAVIWEDNLREKKVLALESVTELFILSLQCNFDETFLLSISLLLS